MAKQTTLELHKEALWRAVVYIQAHLHQPITLQDIAKAAHYSPYHLHRLFKVCFKDSIKAYIRRLRLEQAAFALKISNSPIIDIALQSGFDTHETFTRAFFKSFHQNPSHYRKQTTLDQYTNDQYIEKVELVHFSGRQCVYQRYLGPYEDTPLPPAPHSIWQQLKPKKQRLIDCELFGISHDDPTITKHHDIRYDACITIEDGAKETTPTCQLPSGLTIHAIHVGPFKELTKSYHYLIYHWSKLFNLKIHLYEAPFEKFNLIEKQNKLKIKSIDIFIPLSRENHSQI